MAAATQNFNTKKIIAGTPGEIWTGIAVPAAGAALTLDAATGRPDTTANPNAKHLGMTREGSTAIFEVSTTDYFADEFPYPIKTVQEQISGKIEGELLQIMDYSVLEQLTPGWGTKTVSTPAGRDMLTIGRRSIVYTGVALIFPLEEDPTKFAAVHLYEAINMGGLTFTVSRQGMAGTPFSFVGRAITTRAPADVFGAVSSPTIP